MQNIEQETNCRSLYVKFFTFYNLRFLFQAFVAFTSNDQRLDKILKQL